MTDIETDGRPAPQSCLDDPRKIDRATGSRPAGLP